MGTRKNDCMWRLSSLKIPMVHQCLVGRCVLAVCAFLRPFDLVDVVKTFFLRCVYPCAESHAEDAVKDICDALELTDAAADAQAAIGMLHTPVIVSSSVDVLAEMIPYS